MIVLARHGVTDYNAQGRFLGSTDLPLNDEGRHQCEALAEALRGYRFTRCFLSPMRRCIETSEILVPNLECIVEPPLREIDFGRWESRTREWIERNDPKGLAERGRDPVHFRPEGGESFVDVALRLQPFAQRLLGEPGDVLIVAHRGSLGVLERLLRGMPLESQAVIPLEPAQFREVR